MAGTGLQMQESLIQPDCKGYVHLLVKNPSHKTHKLSVGMAVGQLEPCVEVSPGELVDNESSKEPMGLVNQVQDDNVQRERVEKVKGMLRVSEDGLMPEERRRVRDFVLDAYDVFALSELERGEVEGIRHEIDTGDNPLIHEPPRRVLYSLRPKIKELVDDTLKAKVVQESNSPWSSPVVLVKKKSGGLRFCIDYRALNAVTRKDVFRRPTSMTCWISLVAKRSLPLWKPAQGTGRSRWVLTHRRRQPSQHMMGCTNIGSCPLVCAMGQLHFSD